MRSLLALLLVATAGPALAQDEASLRRADALQHAAARANDGPALAAMAHPNFRLFAPEGWIGNRDRLVARFKSAETGYTRFERTAESVTVTGATGVVMGRELIARADGRPIRRRFTNIWTWDGKRWLWLARHAQLDDQQGAK